MKMKRTIISLTIAIFCSLQCVWCNGNFHLYGELKDIGDTLILINEQSRQRDTVMVKDGRFDVILSLDKVSFLYLTNPSNIVTQSLDAFVFYAVPGEEMQVTGAIRGKYEISGSRYYMQWREALQTLSPIINKQANTVREMAKMEEKGLNADSIKKYRQQYYTPLNRQLNDAILGFISEHPDYDISTALLIVYHVKGNDLERGLGLISEKARNGCMKEVYDQFSEGFRKSKQRNVEISAKRVIGMDAPDFSLVTLDGQTLTISSLRGKYVVLDFWGSWCGYCISAFPKMKEHYQKNKAKYEIVGVNCYDTQEEWRLAVEKYQLPWLQVINGKENMDITKKYGVQAYPTYVIISPEGKIIKWIVDDVDMYRRCMDEIMENR